MGDRDQGSGHKLFVGGLPTDCTKEELDIVFSTYGKVNHIYIMPPKEGKPFRSAFVFYNDERAAEDAIEVLNETYKIRHEAQQGIQVRWGQGSQPSGGRGGGGDYKDDRGGSDRQDRRDDRNDRRDDRRDDKRDDRRDDRRDHREDLPRGGAAQGPDRDGYKLFVAGLPGDCVEEELTSVFSTYGTVNKVMFMGEPHKTTGLRAAFVFYETREGAEDAIKVLDNQYKIRHEAHAPIQVRWGTSKGDQNKGGNDWGGGDKWKDDKQNWQKDNKQDWGGKQQGNSWDRGGGGDKWNDKKDNRGGSDWKDSGSGGGRGSDWKNDWDKKGDSGKDWDRGGGGSSAKLYVKNMPEDIKEDAVEYVFKTYGAVEKITLHTNKSVNGCISGFVEYRKVEDAEVAISALHDVYEIRPDYGPIQVKFALDKNRAKPY